MSRRADGRKVSEWRGRFERYRRSGLSVTRFCAAEQVSVPSFYQWRKKLAARQTPASVHPASFVPASFAAVQVGGGASVAAWVPGGTRLEIPLGDVRALQLAIETLVRADAERAGGATC